jgi:hypothetical protein
MHVSFFPLAYFRMHCARVCICMRAYTRACTCSHRAAAAGRRQPRGGGTQETRLGQHTCSQRTQTATKKPSLKSCSATSRPRPRPAPVTTATRPPPLPLPPPPPAAAPPTLPASCRPSTVPRRARLTQSLPRGGSEKSAARPRTRDPRVHPPARAGVYANARGLITTAAHVLRNPGVRCSKSMCPKIPPSFPDPHSRACPAEDMKQALPLARRSSCSTSNGLLRAPARFRLSGIESLFWGLSSRSVYITWVCFWTNGCAFFKFLSIVFAV